MQAAAVTASESIGQGAPPTDLSEFMAWVNRNGDHFAGNQSARKQLMQSVESLQRMQSLLAQEWSTLKKVRCWVGLLCDQEVATKLFAVLSMVNCLQVACMIVCGVATG